MQNAKDTFYEVLRARLAAINPERTVAVRGATRPGVLVVENELAATQNPPDCFALRWTAMTADTHGAMPTVALTCEIGYATAGTAMSGGTDRGRALAAMNAELFLLLTQEPRNAVKTSYSVSEAAGTTATAMATRIWWGDAVFAEAKTVGERLERTVRVPVMSYQEAGEL